ncbi:MaoC family dehydratase N-terminal domain-containing protein [Streptomyces cinereospinus]|uniref:MaoC family dehydratase N-terminal domain-containing protein n=1 Tax=Streptomyces cinereospinus TaxID=285561 RepID=A0ABV5MXS0_9ACTN
MTIPSSAVGTGLPPVRMDVERGRLRFFAQAIGENDPVYTDVGAARAQGHRDLPVPPTFLFAIELEQRDPFGYLTDLGVDLRRVLHGEQSFTYHTLGYAGDTLVARSTISDTYQKKGGALEFIVKDTAVTRGDGERIADLRSVLVVQNPEVRR